jgi:hypothetical protein
MKKFVILTIVIIWAQSLIIAQNPVQSEKIVIEQKGFKTIKEQCRKSINIDAGTPIVTTKNTEIQIIWSGIEDVSTGGQIKVSSATENTFTGWNLNDDRCSYYPDYFYPLWESNFSEEADFCVDMLEDGSLMAAGKGDSAKVFLPSSNVTVWKQHFAGSVVGIALSPDGSTVYLSEEISSSNKVYSFIIETASLNWEKTYADDYYGNGLVLSGNGDFLVFYQYQNIYILNPDDGSEIDQVGNYGEAVPAISHDGYILVTGDYNGYAQVYEYDSGTHTYNQLWTFHETGGIYSPWITSMSVSSDGTTIAIGSLIYEDPNNDIYNGKLHLFDTYSGTPVWSFENMGHFVSSIDMSYDGSTIAVGTWGPVDNSIPDFFLFERNCNEPIFTINSPGSIRHTDISSDGTICSLSGKAIHETTFGNGGTIYCVNTNLIPPAPENIGIQTDENVATVFWDMPEILDFNIFNIYSSFDNGDFTLLESITDTIYNYMMPLEGYYQFYVTTVDLAEQESENSDTVSCLYNLISLENDLQVLTNLLSQNSPNPFNTETTISYSIPVNNNVSIEIYNIQGKKIKTLVNEYQASGNHSVVWNGKDDKGKAVSIGIYYYNIKAGKFFSTKKMVLTK